MEYPISEEKRQHDWNKFSMWSLMSKYYEAKENYYSGAPKLTDQEFDALEGSIKAIHGKGFLQKWGCVGYDYNKHLAVKLIFARWQFVDRENQKLHNFWAKEKNLLIGIDFSVNESESVGVLFEKKSGFLKVFLTKSF